MNLIIIDLFRYFHNFLKFLRSYLMIDLKDLSVKIISYKTANFVSEQALYWKSAHTLIASIRPSTSPRLSFSPEPQFNDPSSS